MNDIPLAPVPDDHPALRAVYDVCNSHEEYDTMSDLLICMLWPDVEMRADAEEALESDLFADV